MTKMDCLYGGTSPFMQRDGQHCQVPAWQQGLPDTATQEVTTRQRRITVAATPAASLPLFRSHCSWMPCRHAGCRSCPQPAASAFLESVSPSLDLHGCGGIAPNGTPTAAATGLVSFITAALRDSAVLWQLTLPSSP